MNILNPAFKYTPSFATDIRKTFKGAATMKSSTSVRVYLNIKYDVEFAGPQVNVVDFYAVNEDGSYCTSLTSLPREARLQIIEQIVCDAADKDRAKAAALEDFDPLEASVGISPLTGGGVIFR